MSKCLVKSDDMFVGRYGVALDSAKAAIIRPRMAIMATNCLPVSAHQFDAAVERAAL